MTMLEPLSDRELEVLKLVRDGLDNEAIAERLGRKCSTVVYHLTNIYGKLQTANRVQAVVKALEMGLIELRD